MINVTRLVLTNNNVSIPPTKDVVGLVKTTSEYLSYSDVYLLQYVFDTEEHRINWENSLPENIRKYIE